jgi:hypothetical protein
MTSLARLDKLETDLQNSADTRSVEKHGSSSFISFGGPEGLAGLSPGWAS